VGDLAGGATHPENAGSVQPVSRPDRPVTMALRLALLGALLLMPLPLAAQTEWSWITETTVTWGRGGFAYQGTGTDAVATGDLGVRWTKPDGSGWGLSFTSGYDAANEAFLIGGRGRHSRTWSEHRWEGSLAVLFSSLDQGGVGGIAGVAFYPWTWGALVLQLDAMPTNAQIGCVAGQICNGPSTLSGGSDVALSYGVRLAERPALASWLAVGAAGLLAWAIGDELSCC